MPRLSVVGDWAQRSSAPWLYDVEADTESGEHWRSASTRNRRAGHRLEATGNVNDDNFVQFASPGACYSCFGRMPMMSWKNSVLSRLWSLCGDRPPSSCSPFKIGTRTEKATP